MKFILLAVGAVACSTAECETLQVELKTAETTRRAYCKGRSGRTHTHHECKERENAAEAA